MMNKMTGIALRQQAIFVPLPPNESPILPIQEHTSLFAVNLAKLGYGLNEDLLHALNSVEPAFLDDLLRTFRKVMGINRNWTPLVKGWDVPTGESLDDYINTFFANAFGLKGPRLLCGHVIPEGTFPLERYNGCPFCGTPFEFGEIEVMGQGSKLKVLNLWREKDVDGYFRDLLASKTALDATQIDSLKILLTERPLPKVTVEMKETRMAVIGHLVEQGKDDEAGKLFSSPTDVLRYLWYKHTGHLMLVEPRTIIARKSKNRGHMRISQDKKEEGRLAAQKELKLKYGRRECRRVAVWLNDLKVAPIKATEMMHPKREIWVRFIRALRLVEYSKRKGFERLKALLEVFHRESYDVWQGKVDQARLAKNAEETFRLLKERPGVFARSLFANMLWFGAKPTVAAFGDISDQVPARLLFTLAMYAPNYFSKEFARPVKPLGGVNKSIPPHPLVRKYSDKKLEGMQKKVRKLCISVMEKRFASLENPNQTIYIASELYKMPVAIGDRSEEVQDLPVELMGTRFPVEGNKVRLFLQWGVGLPAQHLDMDLSCDVAYADRRDRCSYSNLVTKGCKHSGDIINIPEKVGTAEYIELNLKTLTKAKALYVTFTCNAFSRGELSPNLVVGWMNSKHPMTISDKTGVAYDPSTVQHQVRITQGLTKGLVFGVLDVAAREIVWLEMAFQGQTVRTLDQSGVMALLGRLDSKLNIGNLLELKATAQGLRLVGEEDKDSADESYTKEWGRNAAAVTKLLVD